jgi:hypothetical protein
VAILFTVGSAVAAMAAVCLVLWATLGEGISPAKGDFAEVLRRMRSANSVAYDLVFRLPGHPEEQAQVITAAGHARITWGDGRVHVFDGVRHEIQALSPARKEVTVAKSWGESPRWNLLESLTQIEESGAQRVGRETVDGRDTDVFRSSSPEGSVRLWVDLEKDLPVQVEFEVGQADGPKAVLAMKRLHWNLPVDTALFTLGVPAGYTLREPDLTESSEKDLIRLLRLCAEKSAGAFPPKLDVPAVSAVIEGRPENEVTATVHVGDDDYSVGSVRDECKDALRDCLGGLTFVHGVREKGEWQYVGNGVRLGDGNAEVCWWRSPGSSTRRVIFGDLRISDAPPRP